MEETAITIFLTQDVGLADTFTLTCSDCPNSNLHEDVRSHRFTGLVPYTTYTFLATSLAGGHDRKESKAADIKCTASVGRTLTLSCIVTIAAYTYV